jgi:hypothetical protein
MPVGALVMSQISHLLFHVALLVQIMYNWSSHWTRTYDLCFTFSARMLHSIYIFSNFGDTMYYFNTIYYFNAWAYKEIIQILQDSNPHTWPLVPWCSNFILQHATGEGSTSVASRRLGQGSETERGEEYDHPDRTMGIYVVCGWEGPELWQIHWQIFMMPEEKWKLHFKGDGIKLHWITMPQKCSFTVMRPHCK